MIDFLEGVVELQENNHLILNVRGVGYRLFLPAESIAYVSNIPPQEVIKLYTYIVYKEDGRALFGFTEPVERKVFESLISVSGIGGATALSMLSTMGTRGVCEAIVRGDSTAIATTKGLGKKTSEKVIIELKDKIHNLSVPSESKDNTLQTRNELEQNGINALVNLGINKNVATKSVRKIIEQEPEISIEELIRKSLNRI